MRSSRLRALRLAVLVYVPCLLYGNLRPALRLVSEDPLLSSALGVLVLFPTFVFLMHRVLAYVFPTKVPTEK